MGNSKLFSYNFFHIENIHNTLNIETISSKFKQNNEEKSSFKVFKNKNDQKIHVLPYQYFINITLFKIQYKKLYFFNWF